MLVIVIIWSLLLFPTVLLPCLQRHLLSLRFGLLLMTWHQEVHGKLIQMATSPRRLILMTTQALVWQLHFWSPSCRYLLLIINATKTRLAWMCSRWNFGWNILVAGLDGFKMVILISLLWVRKLAIDYALISCKLAIAVCSCLSILFMSQKQCCLHMHLVGDVDKLVIIDVLLCVDTFLVSYLDDCL